MMDRIVSPWVDVGAIVVIAVLLTVVVLEVRRARRQRHRELEERALRH